VPGALSPSQVRHTLLNGWPVPIVKVSAFVILQFLLFTASLYLTYRQGRLPAAGVLPPSGGYNSGGSGQGAAQAGTPSIPVAVPSRELLELPGDSVGCQVITFPAGNMEGDAQPPSPMDDEEGIEPRDGIASPVKRRAVLREGEERPAGVAAEALAKMVESAMANIAEEQRPLAEFMRLMLESALGRAQAAMQAEIGEVRRNQKHVDKRVDDLAQGVKGLERDNKRAREKLEALEREVRALQQGRVPSPWSAVPSPSSIAAPSAAPTAQASASVPPAAPGTGPWTRRSPPRSADPRAEAVVGTFTSSTPAEVELFLGALISEAGIGTEAIVDVYTRGGRRPRVGFIKFVQADDMWRFLRFMRRSGDDRQTPGGERCWASPSRTREERDRTRPVGRTMRLLREFMAGLPEAERLVRGDINGTYAEFREQVRMTCNGTDWGRVAYYDAKRRWIVKTARDLVFVPEALRERLARALSDAEEVLR